MARSAAEEAFDKLEDYELPPSLCRTCARCRKASAEGRTAHLLPCPQHMNEVAAG